MTARKPRQTVSAEELQRPFSEPGNAVRAVLSPAQFAELLGISPKTLNHWISQGRLGGSFLKRGKQVLIWRDRALDILFNGPDWSNEPSND